MIVYNISLQVNRRINDEWLLWQKMEHIPEVMASGYFIDYKFFHLLEQNEDDAITYIVQYSASSIDHYYQYMDKAAAAFRKKINEKWDDELIAFRTIMEIVH